MIMNRYRKGVNVGGWLSQYQSFSNKHFDTFISKEDVERIASWGFDHIRLPVDYPLLEDDAAPFIYKEEGFRYIDRFLSWCSEYGLNVVLDLHKAPGYGFFENDNTLFEDERMQERLIGIWKAIADRYSHEGENLLFELLNEVVEDDSSRWNALYPRLVQGVRESDSARWIIVGGNRYNAVGELRNLSLIEDGRIVYNFHFYEPYLFTHQRMQWVDVLRDYDKALYFPGQNK
jgi:endoglucanase